MTQCVTFYKMSISVQKEKKSADLHIRIKPSVKEMAEKMAEEDERTLADSIERILKSEYQRRKEIAGLKRKKRSD